MTEPRRNEDLCPMTDLLPGECHHCGARPGSTITIEPPRPHHLTALREEVTRTLERPSLPTTWQPIAGDGECRCGRPARDEAFLCDGCISRFKHTLADLPQLDDELAVTITRQRAAATTGGPKSADTSLPWHERAADARRTLHGLLILWVRFCVDEHVRGPETPEPANAIASLAPWLATRVNGLALRDIAPEAVDEITDAASQCHRIVFWKRATRLYLGTCGQTVRDDDDEIVTPSCPGEVYADDGDPVGVCDDCGQGVTVVIRKAEIDKQLHDRLCTPAEIATYAVHLGLSAPREKVRRRVNYWHRHKRIEHKGDNADGDPLFQYGEVRQMLYAEFGRTSM